MVQRLDPFSPDVIVTVNRKPDINLDLTILAAYTRIIRKKESLLMTDPILYPTSCNVQASSQSTSHHSTQSNPILRFLSFNDWGAGRKKSGYHSKKIHMTRFLVATDSLHQRDYNEKKGSLSWVPGTMWFVSPI